MTRHPSRYPIRSPGPTITSRTPDRMGQTKPSCRKSAAKKIRLICSSGTAARKPQVELCHLQAWVRATGERIIIVLEGRDAAGKGGTIKAMTARVSPRVFRVVALPAPSDREKGQMYMQRYVERFPTAGEIVIF